MRIYYKVIFKGDSGSYESLSPLYLSVSIHFSKMLLSPALPFLRHHPLQ